MKGIRELIKSPMQNWSKPLIILGGLGICLMLISSMWSDFSSDVSPLPEQGMLVSTSSSNEIISSTQNASVAGSEEEVLERRLESALQPIVGIGQVKVAISLDSGTRYEYATNLNTNQREVTERDDRGGVRSTVEKIQDQELVLMPNSQQSSSQLLLVQEIRPSIKGVLVVAEGAEDARVREELTRTVQIALDVPAHKIKVMPGEKREGR
jgi:stage III sporulation protein AG